MKVPLADISGVCVYVRSSEVVRYDDVPDWAQINLAGEGDLR